MPFASDNEVSMKYSFKIVLICTYWIINDNEHLSEFLCELS
jgi:hypothetical protein